MLEPGLAVTPTPIAPNPHRPRPNKGLVLSRSSQGFHPPRSVSSMRSLLPLKLSGPTTNHPSSAASIRGELPGLEMDVDESHAAYNLAELLVQDLEDSESVFRSKSMTSGCPTQGLAAAHGDEDSRSSFHGPDIPRYSPSRYQQQQPPIRGYRRKSHLMADELDKLAATTGQDRRMSYGGDCSDSASESSIAIEPPSIRTRQQSVTTAATSVSGRCSSFTSPKFLSPVSTSSSSASFSNRPQQHRQGTWFDADDDSNTSLEGCTDSQNRHSFYFHHRTQSLGEKDAAMRPSVSTNFHFPMRNPADIERPQTSAGIPLMEKPRLVNIQSSVTVPKRRSSLKKSHGRLSSISSTSCPRERLDEKFPGQYDQDEFHQNENGHFLNPSSSISMLTTSCGRTIIDASRPSSMDLNAEPSQRRAQTAPHSRLSVIENDDFDDREPTGGYIYPERPTRPRDLSQGNVHNWLDSGTPNHSFGAADIPHSTSTPGVPLPPEVIDTLRISLSCFPETMLLSSSLSIETIRAYSRKFRHQVGGGPTNNTHHHPDDSRSVFSFSSHGTKRGKRWRLQRLISSNKRDKHHHHQNNNSNYNPHSNHPKGSFASSDHMSPQETHHPAPMTPNWAPIKRIFPAGSDYLCDALFAHLIAYNYLNTLCPVPLLKSPTINLSPTPRYQTNETNASPGRKVPKKAASVLGMQNLAAAASSVSLFPFPLKHMASSSSRRFLSLSSHDHHRDADRGSIMSGVVGHGFGHGSGGIETAVIRDLQAGLTRCIGLLVNTLERTSGDVLLDEQLQQQQQQGERMRSSRSRSRSKSRTGLRDGDWGGEVEANHVIDGVLMRSLCEVVRGSEEAAVW